MHLGIVIIGIGVHYVVIPDRLLIVGDFAQAADKVREIQQYIPVISRIYFLVLHDKHFLRYAIRIGFPPIVQPMHAFEQKFCYLSHHSI